MKKVIITSQYIELIDGYMSIIQVQLPCENLKKDWDLTNLLICDLKLLGEVLSKDWGGFNYAEYRAKEKTIYENNLEVLIRNTKNEIEKIKRVIKRIRPNMRENDLPFKKIESIYLD